MKRGKESKRMSRQADHSACQPIRSAHRRRPRVSQRESARRRSPAEAPPRLVHVEVRRHRRHVVAHAAQPAGAELAAAAAPLSPLERRARHADVRHAVKAVASEFAHGTHAQLQPMYVVSTSRLLLTSTATVRNHSSLSPQGVMQGSANS